MLPTKKTCLQPFDVDHTLSMPELEHLLEAVAAQNDVDSAEREWLEKLEAAAGEKSSAGA